MKKHILKFTLFFLFPIWGLGSICYAQVGINTTTPNAMLDIDSNNSGVLIPRVALTATTDNTTVINPQGGPLQESTLIYNTATDGTPPNNVVPGFYYWDGTAWVAIGGTATAAGEFVSISGIVQNTTDVDNDHFVFGSTSLDDITGTDDNYRMFFNKAKGAFRAGYASGTEWDDTNVGVVSTAFGESSTASGDNSMAWGNLNVASGSLSTAFGNNTTASGVNATAFGNNTTASGVNATAFGANTSATRLNSTAFGSNAHATGNYATAWGVGNTAASSTETVFGLYATLAGGNPNNWVLTDRLFAIGNGTNNANRSDALSILKDGLTRLPATTIAMITAADGKAVVTKEYLEDYTGGGGGSGEFISIGGIVQNTTDVDNDHFVFGSTSLDNIAGINDDRRMFFNKAKAAFRAGLATGTQWDDINVGNRSVSFGYNNTASGANSAAFGVTTTASGLSSAAFGYNTTASEGYSVAFGYSTTASGVGSVAFGELTTASGNNSVAFGGFGTTASGYFSAAFGHETTAEGANSAAFGVTTIASGTNSAAFGGGTTASGLSSIAFGTNNIAEGNYSAAFGQNTTASGSHSIATGFNTTTSGVGSVVFGSNNTSASIYETVFGRFATLAAGSPTSWMVNDRLFAIGNGSGNASRSNALTILKNGRMGLQSVTNPTYALQLPNSSTNGIGQAQANAWNTYSDGRLKTNRAMLPYGLKEIMRLEPLAYFHHNSEINNGILTIQEEGKEQIGFIAQDMYQIIPEIVGVPEDETKELWGISYDKLTPVLVKAVQELKAENDELKVRLERLEKLLLEKE